MAKASYFFNDVIWHYYDIMNERVNRFSNRNKKGKQNPYNAI